VASADGKVSRPRLHPLTAAQFPASGLLDIPGFGLDEQLEHRIILLAQHCGAPILRRYLEAYAVHQWKYEPADVHRILDRLRNDAGILKYSTVRNEQNPERSSGTYGLRELTDDERAALQALIAERDALFSGTELGKCGERWVRSHFKRADRYKSVTPESKLGYVADDAGKHRIDLCVTDTRDGSRWAISVRNRRQHLERRTEAWVDELVRMVHDRKQNERPWIITSFVTNEMIERCEERGFRCTPMNARIYPETYDGTKQTRKAIADLLITFGPVPFRCIGASRAHPDEFDFDFIERLTSAPTFAKKS
jgi:hypothetical protein